MRRCAALVKHPPQRNDRTTKPKRRAPKGNAAEPLDTLFLANEKPKTVRFGFFVVGMSGMPANCAGGLRRSAERLANHAVVSRSFLYKPFSAPHGLATHSYHEKSAARALFRGRNEWTRTTDPHLIRVVL